MTTALPQNPLSIGGRGKQASGWWGMCMLIVTEASLFGYLLLSYYYLWAQTEQNWPPEGQPALLLPGMNTALLLTSSLCVYFAERSLRKSHLRGAVSWLLGAMILGGGFIGVQLHEWHGRDYGIATNLYGSLYYTITGFHLLHVAVGLVVLALLTLWTGLGYFDARRTEALKIGAVYWHFVDAVWLFIFTTFFLVPYF